MRKIVLSIALLFCLAQLSAKLIVPQACEKPETLYVHETRLVDPWAWLKDSDNPELLRHLKREENYAKSILKSSRKLAKELYQEFLDGISDETESFPWFYKGYHYYSSSPKDKVYPLYYRKAGQLSAKPELILDLNALAKGKDYFDLGLYSLSPDQAYLAYSVDDSGDEDYRLYIKDLSSGKTRDSGLSGVSDLCWYADSNHFLFIRSNERLQSNTCYLCSREDFTPKLLYTEINPEFDLSLYSSTDKSKIFLLAYNKASTEVFETPAEDAHGVFISFGGREPKQVYYPDFLDGRYYIQSNHAHPESPIYTCMSAAKDRDNWQELILPKDTQPIDDYLILEDYLVLMYREDGFDAIAIHERLGGKEIGKFKPQQASDLAFWHNPDPQTDSFSFTMENSLFPQTIYQYHVPSGHIEELYQYPERIKRDYSQYASEILWVNTSDGNKIPLSIVYKKTDNPGPRPLWLNGYGAYGSCEEPYFSHTRFSLLDRGIIYAVAHVRGGGELGSSWYEAGKKQSKKNSFEDFIACMDYLIDNRYTTAGQMLIEGASAGGLLMGAVANMAPEKCALVIADVPFVDAVNTMLDDSLPLTVQEYEEWGDPHDQQAFHYIHSYSPYDNISPQNYPAFLISAGWNDTRVGYWEALKWAQKLRKNQLAPNPIVYQLSDGEGHLGSSDRFVSLLQYAKNMAFALSRISPAKRK